LEVEDSPGVFAQVTQTLAQHHIGLASVIQRDPGLLGSAEVVLLTYSALESALSNAERDLKNLPSVRSVRARIRVDAPDARGARA
jgi:predicted regulator of amino acid metabolism with ACT domain